MAELLAAVISEHIQDQKLITSVNYQIDQLVSIKTDISRAALIAQSTAHKIDSLQITPSIDTSINTLVDSRDRLERCYTALKSVVNNLLISSKQRPTIDRTTCSNVSSSTNNSNTIVHASKCPKAVDRHTAETFLRNTAKLLTRIDDVSPQTVLLKLLYFTKSQDRLPLTMSISKRQRIDELPIPNDTLIQIGPLPPST